MSDGLFEALDEVDALSRGTRCEKFLFSLSLSPPKDANVSAEDFEKAIDKAEEALGLSGQPRAIVFHEKGDHRDRHAHAVWSRIDSSQMKAIPLPYNLMRLRQVSRELFVERGWDVPRGLIDRSERNPLNYTFEQYQHAKRTDQCAADLKARMIDAWAYSDTRSAFAAALHDKGLRLAKGDRRGFVAVDTNGEVYSLPKWLGIKTKAVRDRLGKEHDLPSVDETKRSLASDMLDKMSQFQAELKQRSEHHRDERQAQRRILIEKQRAEREQAIAAIQARADQEARDRQSKFRKGLPGLWDWVRGENRRISKENEVDAKRCDQRDKAEREALVARQREQRAFAVKRQLRLRDDLRTKFQSVQEDREQFIAMRVGTQTDRRERARTESKQERPKRSTYRGDIEP
jgi:hypothetical protein